MTTPSDENAPASAAVPWWSRRFPELALAVVIYVPLLLTQRGTVGADTKTYLYLDPAKLLSDAPYLWDPGTGLGTVTHQNIGYLWPSGPFYWFFENIGVPDWFAQRLWLGSIMFAAGLGVLVLLRELGWGNDRPGDGRLGRAGYWNGGMLVAAFVYALSPYVLDYAARISVILLPWAALPWLILLVERALRRRDWRNPALFALVVLTVGAINATSLFLVGFGPLLWLVWRGLVERDVDGRTVFAVIGRIGLLTVSVSAWWLAGLVLQGAYSVPIVRYTETYQAVAVASTAPEVLRGLGYWFFYGNDKLGQWIVPSVHYMRLGVPVSFAVPVLALLSGALLQFRRRGFFLAMIVVGTVIAVGGHPYDNPSPAGAVLRAFTRSDMGLAFRSTPRAVPLIVLGTAVLLGAGLNALADRLPRFTVPLGGLVVILLIVNLPSLFIGQMVDRNLRRPEEIPQYWKDAISTLDAGDHQTRVLELPGTDFAAYRWGNTVDPITPGLMDRPYVARELIPLGSPVSANLVNAIDRPLQEGTFDPQALGPLARLIAAGDVVLRSDLQYERFRTPRPEATWDLLRSVPGLGTPRPFGEGVPNDPTPNLPLLDEVELSTDPDLPNPPAVAVFPVEDAVPIVRALPTTRPIVISGDGDGLVAATAAGLIDPDRAILYSADLLTDDDLTDQVLADGADVVVTDSNRRRARRWGTIRENEGYTEAAGETPLRYDVSDARLDLFPDAGDDGKTVTVQDGGASVTASAYGNPVTYTPGDRAVFALDGDVRTAWKVGAFSEVTGERIVIDLDERTEIDHLDLVQAYRDAPNRWITDVTVRFDGEDPMDVSLDGSSRRPPGQRVDFAARSASQVEIEITGDSVGSRPKLNGISAVGFAEIGLADLRLGEFVRPPVDLIDRLGDELDDHPITFLFQRLRNNPAEPVRDDEEPTLRRIVELPQARSFEIEGDVRLSATAPDQVIDRALGIPDAETGGATVRSSERLEGDVAFRSRSAIDGDPDTAWNTPFATVEGQWIQVEQAAPVAVDHLDLDVVVDERHSLPTRLRISADGGEDRVVDLPAIRQGGDPGTTMTVPVDFAPIRGRTIRVTIDAIAPRTTTDWYSAFPVSLPVAIAELGLPTPGVDESATGDVADLTSCRNDLLILDGTPVPVRLAGTLDDAVARQPLHLTACGDGLDAPSGTHRIESASGLRAGLDVDRLVLSSDAGAERAVGGPTTGETPTVTIDGETRVSYDLSTGSPDEPFWLALGQSRNEGWVAEVDGATISEPTTISGYANGWYVIPDGDGPVTVSLRWTPQRLVWFAAAWSGVAVLLCLGLIVGRRRRAPIAPRGGAEIVLHGLGPDPMSTPTSRTQIVTTLLATAVAAVVAPPAIAAATGAAAIVAMRWSRGPSMVRLAAPVLLALIAGFVMIENVVTRAPVDFIWPVQFEAAHWPGMLVVLLVAVEIGVTVARLRRR